MDETGLTLSTARRTRRVGPKGSGTKLQASLADNIHITVIATISTQDAPVPPFLIYPGQHIMSDWVETRDREPAMMADVSESGYITGYLAERWLVDCFDRHTRNRAGSNRRLLILDGHGSHVQVDFLEACWARNIVCMILPAHLSGIFQPLDVNFFNPLKLAYHRQIDDYQLGSSAASVSKPFFYRWFQRAWKDTAGQRQIRTAWRESGIYPLSKLTMRARSVTPPPTIPLSLEPETPRTLRTLRTIKSKVRTGEIKLQMGFDKAIRALETSLAEKELLEQDLARRTASERLDREVRGSGKRTRFPQGELFDSAYQDAHAEELVARKDREKEARQKRKGKGRARKAPAASNLVESSEAGPSTHIRS